MSVKQFEQVNLDATTKRRLEHLSSITNIAQSRIVADFINSMFAVGVNFSKMSMTVIDEQLENRVIIVCHGLRSSNALTFGKACSEDQWKKQIFDTINKDLKKKAMGLDL